MTATLKTTIIQEPSSSVANITLGSTGGVAFGSSASLAGATSGTTTLAASAAASGTVTFPAGTGTAAVNGLSTNIVSGTVNAGGTNPFPASSGPTSVVFTGIPSWVKRITVMFNGFSTSGTNFPLIQLGSGSVQTTGYSSSGQNIQAGATNATSSTAGFVIFQNSAAYISSGAISFSLLGSNTWVGFGVLANPSSGNVGLPVSGAVTLSGALDRVNITTVGSTDTFDAGSINILYE